MWSWRKSISDLKKPHSNKFLRYKKIKIKKIETLRNAIPTSKGLLKMRSILERRTQVNNNLCLVYMDDITYLPHR